MTTVGGKQAPEEAVFLSDFTDIERPVDVVKPFLDDAGWLTPLACASVAEADLWLSLETARPPGRQRVPPVHVRLGPWRAQGVGQIVAMRWETPAVGAMFPLLDGEIELVPLGRERCRLVLAASYRARPVGAERARGPGSLNRAGEFALRCFLHHVARTFGGVQ